MEKINLLPDDLVPSGLSRELVLLVRKAGVGLGILTLVLVLAGVILRFEFARRSNILAGIMTKVKESDFLTENVEDLRKKADDLRQELEDIQVYLSAGLVWSEKLIQMSSLMPKEVWLTRISFKRSSVKGGQRESLDVRGGLVPLEDIPPINILSAFVNKLKGDKDFFADFDDLLISDVKMAKKNDINIMEFVIQLVLKVNVTEPSLVRP